MKKQYSVSLQPSETELKSAELSSNKQQNPLSFLSEKFLIQSFDNSSDKDITEESEESSTKEVVLDPEVRTKKARMTQVSIAEFMYKNIHLLGFENSFRVLNVAFKECMDNSLDACNTHDIAPIVDISLSKKDKKTYRMIFKDNGPGVDPAEAPNICCRLLYGEKFGQFEILRGQQGLGLTSLILYAQKTTNKPATVTVKRKEDPSAYVYKLAIDISKNRPVVLSKKKVKIDGFESGFIVELELVATYVKKGQHSPLALLEQYLYLNPNLSLTYTDDDGIVINRPAVTTKQPPKLKAVKGVPFHQELGEFCYVFRKNLESSLKDNLLDNYQLTADELKTACEASCYSEHQRSKTVSETQLLVLKQVLNQITENKKPSNEETINTDPNLVRVITKDNTIHYDEVIQTASTPMYFKHGVSRVLLYGFYGGQHLAEDSKVELYRVGNNSPLRYQASSCLITKAVMNYNWKRIGFTQTENEMPRGKLILIVHVCATKIPYTSESKDAIADDLTIRSQIDQCLTLLTRSIKKYLLKLELHKVREEKCHVITKILPELKKSLIEGLEITVDEDPTDVRNTDLWLLSRIMEIPCFYVHKLSPKMVLYNPTNKLFKISLHDKKTLNLLQEVEASPNSYTVVPIRYEPKEHLFKGLSHVKYHVFTHSAVLKY